MKKVSSILTGFSKQFLISAGLMIVLFIPLNIIAQTDSTKTEAPAAAEESSLISPTLEFISTQKSDNSIDLAATLKAKVKGSFIKLPKLKVTFYQVTETGENALGFVITDGTGLALFNYKADSIITDKEGKFHFKAVFAGNKAMEAAEEEVTFKRARLEITPVKEDSLQSVQIKLIDVGTGTEKPVPGILIGVFVHRMFNPLKVGEGTTDENGETTVEIPNKIPGDAKGNLNLIAKLDESELYGNLETSAIQQWGVPVSDKLQELPRALWSEHPPLWMMIAFIVMMCTVWGHYLVIIIQLFRLRKEEPELDSPNIEKIS